MVFKNFVVNVCTFYLHNDMQSVRNLQGYVAVLYEAANWCYI